MEKLFWIIIVVSFIFHLTLRSWIMADSYKNITFSMSKTYMALIMSLLNGLIVIIVYDINRKTISGYYYLTLLFLITVLIYLYKNQEYINDKEYLKEMIENNSTALLTSEGILQKTNSERVKRFAENIIETRQKGIDYMNELIEYD
jgi:tyrosine-protein phosphatase YwqE